MTTAHEEMIRAEVQRIPGRSARELARALGIERGAVNSVLYRHRGTWFQSSDGPVPRWSSLQEGDSYRKPPSALQTLEFILEEEVPVSAPGGNWAMKIQVANLSINDPIALVEWEGARRRIITVSHHAARAADSGKGETNLAAVFAIAASVMAWEMAEAIRRDHPAAIFEFEEVVRDVFLSAVAHAKSRRQSAEL